MAYISTDDVKHIRNTLKKEFPQYKFSVRRDSIYSVTVSFMKGPSFKDWEYRDRYTGEMKVGSLNDGEHHQINHFYTTDFYGIENAKIISENLKNTDNFLEIIRTKKFEKFLNIDGIGETQINSLKSFFSNKSNVSIFIELSSKLNIQSSKSNKDGILRDKNFMFTGKLKGISRAEAKSLIEKNSGNTLSAVSKNLDFLVVGEKPTKRNPPSLVDITSYPSSSFVPPNVLSQTSIPLSLVLIAHISRWPDIFFCWDPVMITPSSKGE